MQPLNRREFLGASAGAVALAACLQQTAAAADTPDELAMLDGLAQAELVRRKEVTARELVEAAIARIERINPQINAVVTPLYERGLERAGATLDGPLAGVPYLIKDLHHLKGAKLTYGSVFFRNNVASLTTEVIQRMERAGLVVIGKTNTPEFGLLPTTEPVLFGPTRNPWDTSISSGGSSGGAAAAVAARIVPLAHASDGGGSIRIPASCCGVFGLKISRGRNPEAPLAEIDGLSVQHCVSRSVRDSAALLDATMGPVPGDRWWAPAAKGPYLKEVGADPGRLRIALTTKSFLGDAVHADCVAAAESTGKLCEELGHVVEEASPPVHGKQFADAFMIIWCSAVGNVLKNIRRLLGKSPPEDQFEPWTWELARREEKHTAGDVEGAWMILQPVSYQMARFMENYDLVLTPVLGRPPVALGELDQKLPYDEFLAKLAAYVPFTPVVNITGQPAMSVPLYWNAAGAPIGSHFIARYGDEATLIRLASQLEQARPWADRRPPISA